MHISVLEINKRDGYYDGGNWAGGARWAFFAIFLVLIIIVVLGTIRINKSRSRQGQQPIYGTRWMTPPSYFQSQNQYNQPTRQDPDMPNAYVPTYTEQAGEYDMGFYDNHGVFHPNENTKGPLYPEAAHHRAFSNQDGAPISASFNQGHESLSNASRHDSFDDLFRRPLGPPPSNTLRNETDERNQRDERNEEDLRVEENGMHERNEGDQRAGLDQTLRH